MTTTTPSVTVQLAPTVSNIAPGSKAETRVKTSGGSQQLSGMLWFCGWLFTIGFAHLVWWKAILALVAWPYFLGITLR